MKKIFFLLAIVVIGCSASCSTTDSLSLKSIDNTNVEENTKSVETNSLGDDGNIYSSDLQSDPNNVKAVCEKMKAIDFTIQQSPITINSSLDILYREEYLDIIKGKISTTTDDGNKEYFADIWKMGLPYEEFLKYKDDYSFYYYDLDGDGLPELGLGTVDGGLLGILKYVVGENEFTVMMSGEPEYNRILGTGQIWYHDGLHADVIRDEYDVLNSNNKWESVFKLEKGIGSIKYYIISICDYQNVNVGEENWNEVTTPFFEATKNAITAMSFEDVFG